MSNYIIHACEQRMYYVNNYLVPSMEKQEINNIDIRCDISHLGNLESCMSIFKSMPNDDNGAWHLQDDIIICKDFKKRTEELSHGIVCGYGWEHDDFINDVGIVTPFRMWWSFPCIYIPNKIARECAKWFYNTAKSHLNYREFVKTNKLDDWFFREFLRIYYPAYHILNLQPNLVDHVDYLIGGTTINKERQNNRVTTRACYFEDLDLVDELEQKIKNNKGESTYD